MHHPMGSNVASDVPKLHVSFGRIVQGIMTDVNDGRRGPAFLRCTNAMNMQGEVCKGTTAIMGSRVREMRIGETVLPVMIIWGLMGLVALVLV
jgi:hypothetical protein